MPTPASPTSATTWPCPAPACARACVQRRQLRLPRPTKRVSPRAAAACKRRRTALAPTSSKTSTGSASPLTGTGPRALTCTKPSTSRRVAAVSRIAPGRGELLHARRQVRGLAHRRVVHVQVVANGPHHHLAGVEPDADLQRQAVRAAHLLGVAAHGGLHGQGGVAGAHGVVFVGKRRPEQGHDAIAQHLVHRALVAVHGVHHALQRRVEELLGVFRIAVARSARSSL